MIVMNPTSISDTPALEHIEKRNAAFLECISDIPVDLKVLFPRVQRILRDPPS